MSKKKDLNELKKAMRRHGGPGNPSVDKMEAEVRSDAFLPITRSRGLPGLNQARSSRVKSTGSAHVGTYVLEWGFDVAIDHVDQFHAWLADHESNLARAPTGVAYRGTYIATFGPAYRPEGRYRTYWALDEMSNLESFAPRETGRRSPFSRALAEFLSFRDESRGTGYSQLYQVAAGTPQY